MGSTLAHFPQQLLSCLWNSFTQSLCLLQPLHSSTLCSGPACVSLPGSVGRMSLLVVLKPGWLDLGSLISTSLRPESAYHSTCLQQETVFACEVFSYLSFSTVKLSLNLSSFWQKCCLLLSHFYPASCTWGAPTPSCCPCGPGAGPGALPCPAHTWLFTSLSLSSDNCHLVYFRCTIFPTFSMEQGVCVCYCNLVFPF